MNILLVLVLVLVLGSSIDLLGEIVFDRVVLGDLPSGPKKNGIQSSSP